MQTNVQLKKVQLSAKQTSFINDGMLHQVQYSVARILADIIEFSARANAEPYLHTANAAADLIDCCEFLMDFEPPVDIEA